MGQLTQMRRANLAGAEVGRVQESNSRGAMPLKSIWALATHRSRASCMASQLSAERPRTCARRRAISGEFRLLPDSTRVRVEGETPSREASSRALMSWGVR